LLPFWQQILYVSINDAFEATTAGAGNHRVNITYLYDTIEVFKFEDKMNLLIFKDNMFLIKGTPTLHLNQL